MSVDTRKAQLFAAAALLRLILFVAFPSLSDLLSHRVELSTPVSSFSRCKSFYSLCVKIIYQLLTQVLKVQEGVFLYTRNVSPYDGGVFHQVQGCNYTPMGTYG